MAVFSRFLKKSEEVSDLFLDKIVTTDKSMFSLFDLVTVIRSKPEWDMVE